MLSTRKQYSVTIGIVPAKAKTLQNVWNKNAIEISAYKDSYKQKIRYAYPYTRGSIALG